MKRLIIAALLLLYTGAAYAEKHCSDCPPDKPCTVEYKASCNTCTYGVYCVNDVWKRGGWESCTALYCGDPVIANPFKDNELVGANAATLTLQSLPGVQPQ